MPVINGIEYFQKNINEIPYEIIKFGNFWLKPNLITFKNRFSWQDHIDLIWKDKGKFKAQSLPFKEVNQIATQIGGLFLERFNNLFENKKKFQNLPMNNAKIMGILNITPDSFSDGGKFFDEKKALEHAKFMNENGAHIIDIGGESTKPNASYVNEDEETKRILKVIEKLAKDNFLISADTRNSSVMSKAIDNGARIINDVSGMSDPLTPSVIAKSSASIVIMHMQGSPQTMQKNPYYKFAPIDIFNFLENKINLAKSYGIELERIAIDPGFGFGKTPKHNMEIMAWLPMFQSLGVPVLLGSSRKSSIAALSRNEAPGDRLAGSIALLCYAYLFGVQILRVHDVLETLQAIRISSNINKEL